MARSEEQTQGRNTTLMTKSAFIALAFSIAILSLRAHALLGFGSTSLEVTASRGIVPFKVTITGPESVIPAAGSQFRPWVGCGFSVDWGDGTQRERPNDCREMLEHTYYKQGQFKITMTGFHPGPDDSPRTDWTRETSVRADAAKDAAAKIFFVKDPAGQTQYEDQNVSARYAAVFSGNADLVLELIDPRGKVVSMEKIPLKESGEGWPMPHDSYLFQNEQKKPIDVKLKLTLVQNGSKVAEATSGAFKMTSQYKPAAK